eukprot:3331794-Pyramimonas_sp.AAC.1
MAVYVVLTHPHLRDVRLSLRHGGSVRPRLTIRGPVQDSEGARPRSDGGFRIWTLAPRARVISLRELMPEVCMLRAQEVVLIEGTALVEPPASRPDDAPVVVVMQGDSLSALFSDSANLPLPMRTHTQPATPEEEKINSPYRGSWRAAGGQLDTLLYGGHSGGLWEMKATDVSLTTEDEAYAAGGKLVSWSLRVCP